MTIGERVAKLEERTETQDEEINSLRLTRHDHAGLLLKHDGRIREMENAVKTMAAEVVPEIQETLRSQAAEIRKTRETQLTHKTKADIWLKILGTLLGVMIAVGQGYVIWFITRLP